MKLHLDTKRLPLLAGQKATDNREYLFVGIDDFSQELYATIMPDKTAFSVAQLLQKHVIAPCPYKIDVEYSDNGTEYKGTAKHEFAMVCHQHGIKQKFTKPACPQANGKAERMIHTLMEMWHDKIEFTDSAHHEKELMRFINYYNTVKPHSALMKKSADGKRQLFTPYEWLEDYFSIMCIIQYCSIHFDLRSQI